jgi:hypothetical protein
VFVDVIAHDVDVSCGAVRRVAGAHPERDAEPSDEHDPRQSWCCDDEAKRLQKWFVDLV